MSWYFWVLLAFGVGCFFVPVIAIIQSKRETDRWWAEHQEPIIRFRLARKKEKDRRATLRRENKAKKRKGRRRKIGRR